VLQERLETIHLHQNQRLITTIGAVDLIKRLKVAKIKDIVHHHHLLLHIHQLIENVVVGTIIIERKGEALQKNIAITDIDIEARIVTIYNKNIDLLEMARKSTKRETGKVNQETLGEIEIMIKAEEGIYQQWIVNVMNYYR
jgi:hypothetical protein